MIPDEFDDGKEDKDDEEEEEEDDDEEEGKDVEAEDEEGAWVNGKVFDELWSKKQECSTISSTRWNPFNLPIW